MPRGLHVNTNNIKLTLKLKRRTVNEHCHTGARGDKNLTYTESRRLAPLHLKNKSFETNYLRIYFTDFHQFFTVLYVFDRRLRI